MDTKIVALAMAAAMAAVGCSKATVDESSGVAEAAAAAAEPTLEPSAPAPAATAAFVDGQVELVRAGSARPLEPGDAIGVGDAVRALSGGSCELRFGDAATITVRPDTLIVIDDAVVLNAAVSIGVYLESGKILNKVRRLDGSSAFTIRTDSSICGVRGTEFAVSSFPGSSVIAVKSGAVGVVAANPVIDLIAGAAKTSALAQASLRLILDSAYAVSSDEELRLGKADTVAIDAALRGIAAEIGLAVPAGSYAPSRAKAVALPFKAVSRAPESSAGDAAILERVGAWSRTGIKSAGVAPVPASKESRDLFKAFDGMSESLSEPSKPEASQAIRASETASQAKAEAIAATWKASGGPIAGSVIRVVGPDVFIVSDKAGSLYGLSSEGAALWRVDTSNGDASLSQAAQFKGLVYLAGSSELVTVAPSTGSVVARVKLDQARSIPGGRIVKFPGAVAVPTVDGFELRDERSGLLKLAIAVSGGTVMSPANYRGLAAVVNKNGLFMLIDPATGEVKGSVQTGAASPSSQAPRLQGSRACFGDGTGLVVMIDIAAMKVLWEKRLPEPTGVTSDVEMGNSGVFIFSKGSVFGYSLAGEALWKPIRGVSAPPLLSKGVLYYGTADGFLVALRLSPPEEIGRAPLGSTASARPLYADGFVYVGTAAGRLVKVDPGKL